MHTPPEFSSLTVSVDGPVATVLLNRPGRLNALSHALLNEIVELSGWLHTRDDIRVATLMGAGRAFSSGFDLGDFATAPSGTSARDGADLGRRATNAWTDVPQLTVAGVHGHCVGGGVVLVGASDIRFAAHDAVFSIPEVDLGIPLAWGGIPRLVREIGPALTKELVLSCRPFTSAEARSIGFINDVVPSDELVSHVASFAASLAAKPAYALRMTKQQVNAVVEEMAGTGRSVGDADMLVYALHDEESRAATRLYLSARAPRDT